MNCLLMGLSRCGKSQYLSSIGQLVGSFKGFNYPVFKIIHNNQIFNVIESETYIVPCQSIKCIFWIITSENLVEIENTLKKIYDRYNNIPVIIIHDQDKDLSQTKLTVVSIKDDKFAPFHHISSQLIQ